MLPLFRNGKLELGAPAKLLGCAPDELLDRLVRQSSTREPSSYGRDASLWVLGIAVAQKGAWPSGEPYAALRDHCDRWGPSFIASGLFDVGVRTTPLRDGELRVTPLYLSRVLDHVRLVSSSGFEPTNPGALLLEIGLRPLPDLAPILEYITRQIGT